MNYFKLLKYRYVISEIYALLATIIAKLMNFTFSVFMVIKPNYFIKLNHPLIY